MFKPKPEVVGMPTKSTSMGPEDDDISLSSDSSSSSEGSEASSAAESLKDDPTEDRWDAFWRQSAFGSIICLAATVIFTTFILMLRQDNEHFEVSVSGFGCSVLRPGTLWL